MLLKKHPVSSIAALSALLFAQSALAADSLTEALTGGKANVSLQYRYEDVNAATSAEAHTVRARVGYTTGTFNGFGAMIEAESVKALNKQFDSKATGQTGNGHAVVADPESNEINQAYLSYSGIDKTVVKWGRQRLILDNARFVGNVGWRQNEQTFDAFTIVNKSLPDTTITAGYVTNVNRIFSDDSATPTSGAFAGNHKMQSTILNATYKGWSLASITGYAYLLDYDVSTTFTANNSDTYGIRLNGSTPMGGNKLLYTAEYAEQTDSNGNATNYTAEYALLEAGVAVPDIATFKVGYELLGTDTGAANTQFKTPLATLHAFNGWTDMFLTTPQQGLEDIYMTVGTKLAGINLAANYHDYSADESTATIDDLGDEWGFVATYNFEKHYTVGLKYSEYSAGDAAAGYVDTEKTWLWGEFKF
jgi:hypothetical protein